LQHDSMAVGQSQAPSRCAVTTWLANQRQSGLHKILARNGWPDFVFAFHDGDEIGPKMLARVAKHTGLSPNDL
jgi:hypothetical protein